MRGQPELLIECNGNGKGCKAKEVIELRATARGTYSEDHVSSELLMRGWTMIGDSDFCPDCTRYIEGEEDNAENV